MTVAGHDVHVVTRGAGIPVLYIHCSLARHEPFLRLMRNAEDTHQITFFDLPSHGQSGDLPKGGDIHTVTRDIAAALMDGPTHIVGHSFGATVALRLANEGAPITGMTLIEPVFFAAAKDKPGYAQHAQEFAPVDAAFDRGDDIAAARAFLDIWGMGIPWDALPPRAQSEALRAVHQIQDAAPALHGDVHGMLDAGGLEGLDIPITLIEGKESPAVVHEIIDTLAERLPRSRRVVLPGGHMVPLTHPREVSREILADLGLG